jgi:hypothetical protein
LNNKVNIEWFIRIMGGRTFSPAQQENVMFLYNRSGLGVCLAILVAALPVFIQYFA